MKDSCSRSAVELLVRGVLAFCGGLLGVGVVLAFAAANPAGAAEQGWVKGDLRLNIRTGGGNEYRILGTIQTGDQVTILTKGEDWIRVQTKDGEAGWIPDGYLEVHTF